jgi:hypothetical protein
MMKRFFYAAFTAAFAVVIAAEFLSCVTGNPLLLSDLDSIGWGNAASFQYYLSARLKLTMLPDPSGAVSVDFDRKGAVRIENVRQTIALPASLEGRALRFHERDQYLYVAFEEGEGVLPFSKDRDGRFSLVLTVDDGYENGVEFVEYEGVRYKPEYSGLELPWLNVVIKQRESGLRRRMGGSRVPAGG